MTKGEAIESIYINVIGGKLSDDVNIQREDINIYFSAAVNTAIVTKIRLDRREAQQDTLMSKSLSSDYIKTYRLSVVPSNEKIRDVHIKLPIRTQALDGNAGIQSVSDINRDFFYEKMGSLQQTRGIEDVLPPFFWHESIDGDEYILIRKASFLVKEVFVRLVPAIEDLEEDDQLPIPPGMETDIIEMCIAYFRKQRHDGADYKIDDKDDAQK